MAIRDHYHNANESQEERSKCSVCGLPEEECDARIGDRPEPATPHHDAYALDKIAETLRLEDWDDVDTFDAVAELVERTGRCAGPGSER